MPENNEEKKGSNISFYAFTGIIGLSFLLIIGYLIYSMFF
jgi:hypothetical protein